MNSYSSPISFGRVNTLIGLNENLSKKNVVIVGNIVDFGHTLEHTLKEVKRHKPKPVKTATLFFKPQSYIKTIKLYYLGMNVANKLLVGYGLNNYEVGKNLKNIYVLNENPKS